MCVPHIGSVQKGRPFASTMQPVALLDKTITASLTSTAQITTARKDARLRTANRLRCVKIHTVCMCVGACVRMRVCMCLLYKCACADVNVPGGWVSDQTGMTCSDW